MFSNRRRSSGAGGGQRAVFIQALAVQPLFGRGQQPAIDLAAELAGGPARPIRGQQSRRQQRIPQHHPPVIMDQQDPRGERVAVRQPLAPADPAAQRLEGLHEFQIGIRRAIERPARAEQAPAAVVLGGNFQPDRAGCFLRDRNARRRDPHARQRAAEAGIFQRLARGVAMTAAADQQELEASGPIGRLRIVDMFGRGIKGLAALLHQTIKAVAADLLALEPAVGREPRHRRAHHAAVDVDRPERIPAAFRARPNRRAARSHRRTR